tara:strand:- start:90 stop:578 length:489 start_codon:yes stop_codon:yes gene_type:complete
MNILKDRSVWIVIVVMILSGIYYWTIVDSERVEEMKTLEESDFDLSGDVNEWSEAYKRLELKWRGTSKHVKTLQIETMKHYKSYESKVDSINNIFDRIEYKIDQMNETLTDRLEDLSTELEDLSEEFSSFKRATQRDGMKVRKNIEAIQEELKELNTKIDEE